MTRDRPTTDCPVPLREFLPVDTQRSWPHRFNVTIHTRAGRAVTYPVVSWLYEEKATAIAVAAHQRTYPDSQSADAIAATTVTDLGPVSRNDDGTTALNSTDLHDRYEF